MYSHPTVAMRPNLPAPPTDDPISSLHLPAALTSILLPPLPPPPPRPFPLRGLAHFLQMNFSGTSSKSLIPEHLVCCQTPQTSHASILSPSSSLAPQVQSTVQFSNPLSILNCTILRLSPVHLPLTLTSWLEPSTCFTRVVSLKFGKSGSCSTW
ncbi:Os01g0877600 [Oryza sativa Japonica Group]|uniref:Os01g0877600 protein n=2 Tax=Oryza sativa subsp. japonica TaxID=39947 RepID=Q0JH88_ORYSJ|nr:hypothetical protein EE612_007149 [Oryza sativa]BAF06890.1 Os01g0877600 [Oryza sativa Japonica Group]BAS75520.1 Os01g0877600 [Oryza sativa Japonica Group]|eukprot:NP_001044976.1 Os01g0877600 [Oryza sativa Japonica Group]